MEQTTDSTELLPNKNLPTAAPLCWGPLTQGHISAGCLYAAMVVSVAAGDAESSSMTRLVTPCVLFSLLHLSPQEPESPCSGPLSQLLCPVCMESLAQVKKKGGTGRLWLSEGSLFSRDSPPHLLASQKTDLSMNISKPCLTSWCFRMLRHSGIRPIRTCAFFFIFVESRPKRSKKKI